MLKKVLEPAKRVSRLVEILPYNPKMLPAIISMHESQKYMDIACIRQDMLPALGSVAFDFDDEDNGTPVAAAFLRMVEGGFAQLDTFVTNANKPSDIRHEGINKCLDSLINQAKALKLHGIIATTKDEITITRALSLGFRVITEQKLIALSLKEPPTNV